MSESGRRIRMGPKKRVFKNLYFYIFLIFITSFVFPDIVKYLTIQELTEGSDIIVIGTVEAKTSSYTADNSSINTNVIINPSSVIKGNIEDGVINVTVWGGEVDDIVLKIQLFKYPIVI
jgi:hypothetical protein